MSVYASSVILYVLVSMPVCVKRELAAAAFVGPGQSLNTCNAVTANLQNCISMYGSNSSYMCCDQVLREAEACIGVVPAETFWDEHVARAVQSGCPGESVCIMMCAIFSLQFIRRCRRYWLVVPLLQFMLSVHAFSCLGRQLSV